MEYSSGDFLFFSLDVKAAVLLSLNEKVTAVFALQTSLFYNIADKVRQFQLSNLLTSSVCSMMLWTHADDTMNH